VFLRLKSKSLSVAKVRTASLEKVVASPPIGVRGLATKTHNWSTFMVSPFAPSVNIDASYPSSKYCSNDLIPFLKWLLPRHKKHGGITEIRAIAEQPVKMICSGYFDPTNRTSLVEQIRPAYDGPRAKIPYGDSPRIGEANFYFSMQPVKSDLLARSAYELTRQKHTTSDSDIVCYSLFAVDVDPVRPSGVSATDSEKAEAREVANKICQWFKAKGIDFFTADSGNGYHILIPTIPYEDVATASANAHTLLDLLHQKFSTDKATVDRTIYNPSRILKLYGTFAMKGSNLLVRPHRFARLSLGNIPKEDVDLFDILANELSGFQKAEGTGKAKPAPKAKTAHSSFASGDSWNAEISCAVLQGLLDRAELLYRVKKKHGDVFYEFKDCPHHDDPDGDKYECCAIVRSDGSFAAKCQHDADAGWQDFKPFIQWEENVGAVKQELGLSSAGKNGNYLQSDAGLVHRMTTKHGDVDVRLTNFMAKIVSETVEDDGVERRLTFEVNATLQGHSANFTMPASEFVTMNWPIERLGAQAVVYAGQGAKDHARAAIQLLSEDVVKQTVFTHLGWAKHNGQNVYLHAGGALGRNGTVDDARVKLSDTFGRFVLPEPVFGKRLVKAVKASLKTLDVAPVTITIPLFAAIWRSVIGGTDFSLHLTGKTGTGKSELAALAQQHWGKELDARHLPASWSSTANALEGQAFLAKDAILVVDDFVPAGSQYDVQRMHKEADRLMRGQGNSSGRGRMRADTTLRPSKPPRGLIVSTGEDVPRGQSLQARLLVLEVSPEMLSWKRLTCRQRDASEGLYAQAMAGFIQWLACRFNNVRKQLPEHLAQHRELAASSDQHKRTPDIVANLYFGVDQFVRFAVSVGALTTKEAKQLRERAWTALGEAAAAQATVQNNSEPVQRFHDLLNAAIASGKAHIASATGEAPEDEEGAWGWQRRGENWEPRGARIGWISKNDLFLEPEAAFGVVQQMAHEGGEPLALNCKTLHKRLQEHGSLVTTDITRKRIVVRRKLDGKVRSVLHLRRKALFTQALAHS
jgi:hypothetical protein